MKVNYNEFLALVYSDLFDFPLTREELHFWTPSKGFYANMAKQSELGKLVEYKEGFCFLLGREGLLQIRKERREISRTKLIKLERLVALIKSVPLVQAVFITGSVAMENAKEEADLDLMIVTIKNCLWITRMVVVVVLKLKRIYREQSVSNGFQTIDKVCTNLFLDISHLEIGEKNLYTAHEVLQAKCLYDRGGVEATWLEKNRWAQQFLPNAYAYRVSHARNKKSNKPVNIVWALTILLSLPELIAFVLQYAYMKGKVTNERIGWGFAFFHPNDLSKTILKKFESRIKKYLAMF